MYEFEFDAMNAELGDDGWKKVGAILRVLEIGKQSIALSKRILESCERCLEILAETDFKY